MKNHVILIIASIILILTCINSAYAATSASPSGNDVIYVNGSNGNDSWDGQSWNTAKLTIKNATETVSNGGTINIANGTYTGANNTGIQINKNMVINGQSQTGTIINAQGKAQIFNITSGKTVTIQNLKLINGKSNDGGTIQNNGIFTLKNCTISNSTSDVGGAIQNNGVSLLQSCYFENNSATKYNGGAIYNNYKYTNLIIQDCNFENNSASESGGAISNLGDSTIINSTFSGNKAENGGAIDVEWKTIIKNCQFIKNKATSEGGAISTSDLCNPTSCSFINNTSGKKGGAIFNCGNLNVHFSYFYGNHADKEGDAIRSEYVTGIPTCVANATNNWWGSNNPNFDKLVSNNRPVDLSPYLVLNISANPNKIDFGKNSTVTAYLIYNSNGENTSNLGALYYPLVTFTSPYGSLSPQNNIIIKGSASTIFTSLIACTHTTVTAQVDDQNVTVNISILLPNDVYVATAADGGSDSGDGSQAHPFLTLNKAISTVAPGGRIHIANGAYKGSGNRGLTISQNMTILRDTWIPGTGSSVIINAENSGGIFLINGAVNVVFKNLTFTQGKASQGSAIYNFNGICTLYSCIFACNAATGYGGAIENSGGNCILNACIFSDNVATNFGGAIDNTVGTLTLTNCIFTGNNANQGGAIYNQDICTLENCTFTGNNATTTGGVIYNSAFNGSGNCTVTSSTFTGNKANQGGAVYNDSGTCTLHFNRFYGNSANNCEAIYSTVSLDATHNWWGSNNPNFSKLINSTVKADPWIILSITANPTSIYIGKTSNIATNLIMDSNGENTLTKYAMYVPDGIPVAFSTSAGNVNPQNSITSVGASNTVFTANLASGSALVYATVDNQTINATIQILSSSDIDITKTVNNTRPNVGNTVTFTVTARNNGPDNATNIQITDKMPAGFSNVVVTPSVGTYDSSTGIWTIPSLVNGATATLTMNGTVTGNIAGKTTANNATKTYQDQVDPNPNNDKTSVSIYVPMADISVAKTVDKNMPNVGDTVTFTVTVINDGPDNATNIQITDIMPAGFSNLAFNPSIGTYDSTTDIWTIPNLANGANATLTLSGIITVAGTVTNTATKTAEDQYDPTPDDDTASASTNAQEADISIIKTVNKQRANVGENVTFTITVTNKGPNKATGLIFIDKLPVGLNYVSAIPTIGSINPIGNYILWNLGDLNNGQTAILTINATIISPGNLTNIVRKIHEDQYDPDIDYANATVYAPEADIIITNTPNQPKVNVGNTATFTVTVRNNGPDTATGVAINDIIPQGFTAHVSKGTFINGVWYIGTLEANEEVALTLMGIITPQWASKTIYNNVSERQNEYNPNPQTATANIYVPQANVSINKVAKPIHFDIGDTVRFITILENHGPDEATGIKVVDKLPTGLEFVSASDGGIYDPISRTITWNLNNLSNGLYQALILETKVKTNISNNIITNIALQSQNEYNNESKTSKATITINKADLYITSTSGNSNPKAGENVKITFKLGNKGPDTAKNVAVKIPIPTGFEFINASVDQGTWTYDASTRTLIWDVGDVQVGDPYLYLNLKAVKDGHYVIIPVITTTTYDPNLENSITPLHINVTSDNGGNNGGNKVHAKTIPLQKTGLPVAGLIVAILMVLGGLCGRRR